jgi:hypothetical protein
MAVIRLDDWGTKSVLSQYGLTPKRRIGKGLFCAVYEDGPESVVKLTTDSIQRESVRDYLEGVHFPAMVADIGFVGTQYKGDMDLFMFKSERLRPTREADAATRKLARQVIRAVDDCWATPAAERARRGRGTQAQLRSAGSRVVLDQLAEFKGLPETIREAFEDVHRLVRDYTNLVIDFHGANLMVRGMDELVFNDVVVDGDLLYPK